MTYLFGFEVLQDFRVKMRKLVKRRLTMEEALDNQLWQVKDRERHIEPRARHGNLEETVDKHFWFQDHLDLLFTQNSLAKKIKMSILTKYKKKLPCSKVSSSGTTRAKCAAKRTRAFSWINVGDSLSCIVVIHSVRRMPTWDTECITTSRTFLARSKRSDVRPSKAVLIFSHNFYPSLY